MPTQFSDESLTIGLYLYFPKSHISCTVPRPWLRFQNEANIVVDDSSPSFICPTFLPSMGYTFTRNVYSEIY